MKKVFIVEDDMVLQSELSKFLKSSGYDTIVLRDFSNVVADILRVQTDLVLLDIHLPNQNGEQILKKLRVMGRMIILQNLIIQQFYFCAWKPFLREWNRIIL